MPAKKRTASQSRWLHEHFSDPYVKQAHKLGLRSRASFKLEELQKKDRLIRQGNIVVDLGAAPGGWSEYAVKCIGENGRVIAMDILPIRPIRNVQFLQGDFRDEEVFKTLYSMIGVGADVVLSDMAPNMSGTVGFVVKVFQGVGSQEYLKELHNDFTTVKVRKPDASRDRSREVYMVATGFKGHPLNGVAPGEENIEDLPEEDLE